MPRSTRTPILALLTAFVVVLAAAPAAMALELTVSTTADSKDGDCPSTHECSLREALELVEEGEEAEPAISGDVTIEITAEGTIEIGDHGELTVEQGEGVGQVTIEGPGAEHLAIDGEGKTRVFVVVDDAFEPGRIYIKDLTVQNGLVDGPAIDGDGGAALLQKEGNVTLEYVHFTDNHILDDRSGGAIDFEGGLLEIFDSTIDYNSTETETIEGNGGGIHQDAINSILTLTNTIVRGNRAGEGSGGGIYQDEGALNIFGGEVSENEASLKGGGIADTDEHGAGTFIDSVEIGENVAGSGGGGIYADDESGLQGQGGVLIQKSTIAGNEAEGRGGGVLADGPMTIVYSTISGNDVPASETGGGIAVTEGPVVLETMTIAENVGAGIYADAGETEVRSSTVAANVAAEDVAGGIVGEAPVKVRSSLLVQNIGKDDVEADCSGTEVTSEGHNAIGTTAAYCNWEAEGDQLGAQAHLGPLADNGGPTKTMAPTKRESAAINHGFQEQNEIHAPLIDQREWTRPVPTGSPTLVDVGAVEVQAPSNTAAPSITPATELTEGEELTCQPGSWDTDTVTNPETGYTWRADGSAIASGDTYELKAADAGKAIKCEVTVDNGATETTATTTSVELEAGEIEVTPTTIPFTPRDIHAGPSAPQSLTVSNHGGTTVTIAGVTGSDDADFPLATADCTGSDSALGPGEHCTVEASFDPATTGGHTSTVTVHSNGGTPTALLSGTGTGPIVSISPASFDFGTREVGSGPGPAEEFEVKNSGTGPAALSGATIEGADFAIAAGGDGCEGETLQPTESCTVEVVFAPVAGGARSGTLRVGGESPASAALTGTGEAPPAPAPTPAPQPQPPIPTPPAPASAVIAGKPGTPHVGDADGEVPLAIACDSPAATPCQVSLELLGGRWSGRVAAGATRTVDFPLTKAARKTLGERERMRAKVVIDVSGGEESTGSVLLVAPPEGRLYVRMARRSGDDLLVSLFCSGGSSPRCGGRVTIEVPVPDVMLAAGEVTTKARDDSARLPLTAAGRRFLDNLPRPSVVAKAVILDPVYQRTETVKTHFRMGE